MGTAKMATVSDILAALAPLGVNVVVSNGTVVVHAPSAANDTAPRPPSSACGRRFCDSYGCEECQAEAWSGDWRSRLLGEPALATVIPLPVRNRRTKRAA